MEMYLFAHSGNYDTDLQTDRPGHREFTLSYLSNKSKRPIDADYVARVND